VFSYFDGLSRYYVLAERQDLIQKFSEPPNVFDGFSLALSAPCNSHVRSLLTQQDQKHKDEISSEREKVSKGRKQLSDVLDQREHALGEIITSLRHEKTGLEQLFHIQSEQTKSEVEVLLRARVEREQQVEAQFLAVEQQVEKEKEDLESKLTIKLTQEREHALKELSDKYKLQLNTARSREQELVDQLGKNQKEAQQAKIEHVSAVNEINRVLSIAIEQYEEAKQQVKTTRTEQRISEREHRDLVKDLAESHNKSLREIHKQYTEQLASAAIRERGLIEQLLQLKQQAHQEKLEHVAALRELERSVVRTIAQRENEYQQKDLAAKKDAKRRELAWTEKEKVLTRHLEHVAQQAHNEKIEFLSAQMKREQAASAQLLVARAQASQENLELVSLHREQELTLQREHADRQQIFTQELLASQEALRALERESANSEKVLLKKIAVLQDETQALHHARQLLEKDHGIELRSKLDENSRLSNASAALESELKAEVILWQQTNARLQQSLAELQKNLATTHSSLSWRITAPMRALAAFVFPQKLATPIVSNPEADAASVRNIENRLHSTQTQAASVREHRTLVLQNDEPPQPATEMAMPVSVGSAQVPSSISTNVQHAFIEAIMPPTAQVNQPFAPAPATTLNELLAYHDQQFILCTYQTLLGRDPDPEGFSYYLGRLRMGYSKIQILMQLRLSDEGKAYACQLPDLDITIDRYRKSRYPLIGRFLASHHLVEGNSAIERKLRAIENQVYRLSFESNQRLERIDANLANLYQVSSENKSSLERIATTITNGNSINRTLESTENLPPRPPTAEDIHIDKLMQRVFHELKHAKK